MMRVTHTYAILEVSQSAYEEIRKKLLAAGYAHAVDEETGEIDMHGIALAVEDADVQEARCVCNVEGKCQFHAGISHRRDISCWNPWRPNAVQSIPPQAQADGDSELQSDLVWPS